MLTPNAYYLHIYLSSLFEITSTTHLAHAPQMMFSQIHDNKLVIFCILNLEKKRVIQSEIPLRTRSVDPSRPRARGDIQGVLRAC